MAIAKEVKDWLSQFPDGHKIEINVDCPHGHTELVTRYNNVEYKLELDASCGITMEMTDKQILAGGK